MQQGVALKFKVTVTDMSDPESVDISEAIKNEDKSLGVLTFFCVPRVGEMFAHADDEGNLVGYRVINVYHYTEETNSSNGTIGLIQAVFQMKDPR